jgi:anti-sigma regulatory factor (Ser/Thr protein kinase)
MSAPLHLTDRTRFHDKPEQVIVRCLYGEQPEHRARCLVTEILAWMGHEDEAFQAELAVSELVTNAVRYAPCPYELRIYLTCAAVKIAVADAGGDHLDLAQRLAATKDGEPSLFESGRGLQLVAGFFEDRCGVEPTLTCVGIGPAKQVWFTLPRHVS